MQIDLEKIEKINRLHDQAMEETDSGNFKKAMRVEAAAARYLWDDLSHEPTRGVLFRSAANLAIDAGQFLEAERLAAAGLAGKPSMEIREELYEALDRARELEKESHKEI